MSKKPVLLFAALLMLASCASGGGTSSEPEPSSSSSSSSSSKSSSSRTSSSSSSSSASEAPEFDPSTVSDSLIIHYHRDDGDYETWGLWLWPKDGALDTTFPFTYQDDYGGVCVTSWDLYGAANEIGVIVRDGSWAKDPDGDRYIDKTAYTMDDNGNISVWLYTGVSTIYSAKPTNIAYLSNCAFTDMTHITIAAGAGALYGVELVVDGVGQGKVALEGVTSYRMELAEPASVASTYMIRATFANEYVLDNDVSLSGIFTDPAFNEAYYYDGELGAIYSEASTTFRVWSPVSSEIELRVYDTGTPAKYADAYHSGSDTPILTQAMTKGDKGVFETTVDGDLDGMYYTYFVKNYLYPSGKEVVDPYARSAGVNGLRGMILDLSKTDPVDFRTWSLPTVDRLSSVVYETHIADLTSSDTWEGNPDDAKKYKGFFEEGTSHTVGDVTVATGFDHIKELGPTHVQILPMFDQANDEINVEFNWGYNPLNYNVPEGCYSSDPYDGKVRVQELKALIQAYGEAGMGIIMDVVYNHVNSVSGQNFDVLMPYYYFRYDGTALMNGSGCGNETASERAMFRKFMIDSTAYWTEEYRLSGFRFDLMGLHDMTTMEEIVAAVEEINPNAIVYGEPWTGGTSGLAASVACTQANISKFKGYGCFNDQIRDGLIAGGMAASTDKAWATIIPVENPTVAQKRKYTADTKAGGAKLTAGIMGGSNRSDDPSVTVSYATCHDNFTLYDRVKAAYANENRVITDEEVAKAALLAQSVVMTSQGTAFMLAGEELLRTKGGDHNSYKSSYEVNEMNYDRKIEFAQLFEDYKTLIEFKKSAPGLHLDQAGVKGLPAGHLVYDKTAYTYFSYEVQGADGVYQVFHANGTHNPETVIDVNLGAAPVVAFDSLHGETSFADGIALKPFQTLIVKKA